jgi:hypothetical protein
MPQVSLTDYRATQEAAERQKRLAAALREQSTSPIQVQSYNGIQAPIPWTEVLARALSGYAANRKEAKADEAIAEGRAKARTEAMDYLKALKQETPQDRFIAPPNFQPEQTGFIDRLKQAGQSFMPQQAPPPQQMSAPPPQPMVAPQAPPPMAPAQPMPMPQGPEAIPQMSDMRQVPAELQNRARSPEEQQQMLMDAMMSGNPYLEKLAPSMYEDIESQTEAAAERQRKIQTILSLDIPEDRKQMLIAGVTLGDNPLAKQAFQGEEYNQGVSGVVARAVDKYMRGDKNITPEEKAFAEAELSATRKRGYIAPPRGNSPGPARREIRTQVGNDGQTYYSSDGVNWYDNRAEAGG